MSNTGGTQDWGGGEIRGSTEDEVRRAVEMAKIQFAGDLYLMGMDIFYSLDEMHKGKPDSEEYKLISKMNEKEPLEVFKSAKISFEMKDCPNVGAKKHAGVSSLSSDATICFNIEKLKKLPVTSLNKALIVLFSHELAHMLGHEEKEAQLFQTIVENAFPVFEMNKILHQYGNMQSDLQSVLVMMNIAFLEHKKTPGSPKFWYAWGTASGKLQSAHDSLYHMSTQFEAVSIEHEKLAEISSRLNSGAMFLSGYASQYLASKDSVEAQRELYRRMEGIFCSMAATYIDLEKLIVNFERVFLENPAMEERLIVMRSREMGVTCPEIPASKFKLAAPNEHFIF